MNGTEEFRALRSNTVSGSGVVIITFVQVAEGIQYSHLNRITIDPEAQHVLNIDIKVFHPPQTFLSRSNWKSEREAESLALEAWQLAFPNADAIELQVGDMFIADNLHPHQRYWAASYTIDVDLVTGEVQINNTAVSVEHSKVELEDGHPDVKNDVCVETANSPRATTCKIEGSSNESVGELTVVELFWDDGTSHMYCSMDNGVACERLQDTSLTDAWKHINDWEKDTDRYSTATDNANFPDIDIVAHSTAKDDKGVPRADYTPPHSGVPNGNIVAPKKGSHPSMKPDVEPLRSREFIIHEAAHAESVFVNPYMASKKHPRLQAIGEAISDLKGVLTPGKYAPPEDSWVFGKTILKEQYQRDMREQRTFSEFDPSKTPHENSTIFSHYFFLLAHKEGVTKSKLLQLITVIPEFIRPANSQTDITTENFIKGVKDTLAAMKATDLHQAADEVHDQMDQPGGNYPQLPTPVIGIFGDYTGCNGANSLATLRWLNSANADVFVVYGRAPSGSWENVGSTTSTQAPVYVRGYPYVDWRVDACNSVGCSVSGSVWRQVNQCSG